MTISNYILLVSIRTLKCEVKWIGNRLIKSLKLRDSNSIEEDNLERVGHFLLRITDDGEMLTVGDLVQSWPHFIILCISKDFLLVAVAWDIPRSSFRLFLSQCAGTKINKKSKNCWKGQKKCYYTQFFLQCTFGCCSIW